MSEWPATPLPSPFRFESGGAPCNTPLIQRVHGQMVEVAFCEVRVVPWNRRRLWRRFTIPAGTHRGRHRVTWGQ